MARIEHNYPAADRWARAVCVIVFNPRDLPTVLDWADAACVPARRIRGICTNVEMTAGRSLQLGRLWRACERAAELRCAPRDVLDIRDHRTVKAWERSLGIGLRHVARSPVDLCALEHLRVDNPVLRRSLNEHVDAQRRARATSPPSTAQWRQGGSWAG